MQSEVSRESSLPTRLCRCTHSHLDTSNRAPGTSSSDEPACSLAGGRGQAGPFQVSATHHQRHPRAIAPTPTSTAFPERAAAMRRMHPPVGLPLLPLGWLLGLLLLAGPSGCGPAPSDEAAHVEPRASVGGPSGSLTGSLDARGPAPGGVEPLAQGPTRPDQRPSASPSSLAPGTESEPAESTEPAPLPAQLVLPQWIAQALEAPAVPVRLRALDLWAQQGRAASMDPLVVALDDEDDDVRTKAMAIIERQWAVVQKVEPMAEP